MLLLREIAALVRYVFRTPNSDKTIVFYAEQQSYWAFLEGVVGQLQSLSPTPFCYVTSDPNDSILKRKDLRIHAFYLNKLLPFFMLFVGCRAFVMTLTDLNQFHLKRSINESVHYVYVFHALNSTHMAYRNGAFDHYDSILCAGPFMVEEIRKREEQQKLKPKQLIEAGYYRLERIHARYVREGVAEHEGRKRVLVAPSWAAHNVVEAHGAALIRSLADANYDVIVRLHPETMKRTPGLVASLEAELADRSNVVFEKTVGSDDSILAADVLITDWSGIALEFAFGTERPVLYLDVPRKVQNDRYQELGIEPFEATMRERVGMVVPVEEIPTIHERVNRLIEERSSYKARIAELRSQNLFAFGRSSEIGARHILNVTQKHAS